VGRREGTSATATRDAPGHEPAHAGKAAGRRQLSASLGGNSPSQGTTALNAAVTSTAAEGTRPQRSDEWQHTAPREALLRRLDDRVNRLILEACNQMRDTPPEVMAATLGFEDVSTSSGL